MTNLISFIRKIINKFGINIVKFNSANDEQKQILAILNLLKINLVLDIGANEGQFANQIFQSGYKKKIISFEPLSAVRNKLKKLSQKKNDWIIYEQCAVGSFNGKIKLNISKNSVSSSILPMLNTHKIAAKNSEYCNNEIVNIIKLDSIKKNFFKSNTSLFIKIDTQGYEHQVLDGAKDLLKQTKGILCELSLVKLYEGQLLWNDIIKKLEKNNFYLWALQRGFTNPYNGQTLQVNGVFLNKKFIKIKNN